MPGFVSILASNLTGCVTFEQIASLSPTPLELLCPRLSNVDQTLSPVHPEVLK